MNQLNSQISGQDLTTGSWFFNNFKSCQDNIAIIDATTGEHYSYDALDQLVTARVAQLGTGPCLVFIETQNTIHTIVNYLACLRGGLVFHLLDTVNSTKAQALIELYQPNIIIGANNAIIENSSYQHQLHPSLALLMATSGSTGSPKFVKLSHSNLESNAVAIAQYLKLTQDDKAYLHLKLHYSYGISILNSHFAVGATTVLTQHGILDGQFWTDLHQYQATSLAGVPYTFETLLHSNFAIENYPHLRYFTQAGGKLEAKLVKQTLALIGDKAEFYIMYGQTEAAPRMSYLPAEQIHQHPDSIGVPVPGGELMVVNEHGQALPNFEPGELKYTGPNVMMGYAMSPEALISDETPEALLTGDIAYQNAQGLFFIVGRTKRFVKLFGLRLNLDDVQTYLKSIHAKSAVTGDDQKIILAFEGLTYKQMQNLHIVRDIAAKYSIPETIFHTVFYEQLPLLSNQKYDYKKMAEAVVKTQNNSSFFIRLKNWVYTTLELNDSKWDSIPELYCRALSRKSINKQESFNSLGADSLSFVEISMELENAFGDKLPVDWRSQSIQELQASYRAL